MSPVARRGDPWTSWEAAESVPHVRDSQQTVYSVLRVFGPLTLAGLVDFYQKRAYWPPQEPSGIRSRCAELVKLGLVVDTGEWERGRTGKRMKLWGIAPPKEAEPVAEGQEDLGL